MRHRKAGVKLGRTGSHRNAMFRNMVTSLLKHDRIRTTDTKAKELRRWADHVITLAKRGDLHARRQALSIVKDKDAVHKLFDRAQELFGDRAGGYTRLTKLGRRAGDGAPMTLVELIMPDKDEKKKKKKDKPAPKKAPVTTQPATGGDLTAPPEKKQGDASPAESEDTPAVVDELEATAAPEPAAVDEEESEDAVETAETTDKVDEASSGDEETGDKEA